MKILSQDFLDNELMPKRFACDGEGINPHLYFEDVPSAAESLVLVVDDPDAPAGTYIHWTVWNIEPQTLEIGQADVPENAIEGITSAGGQGYQPPCPPSSSIHHYIFHLYALDTMLDLTADADFNELISEMQGHIFEEATLTGLYQRQ